MRLTQMCFDDFLDDFETFEKHARGLDYSGVINPVDGVLYPDISADIPVEVAGECLVKIGQIFGVDYTKVKMKIPFTLRLTVKGKEAPHQAHTDQVMGDYNFLLYLDDGDLNCGTSLVEHISGMKAITSEADIETWKRDTNKPEAWKIVGMCQARKNRAAIIPSHLFHRAEPIGGFGTNPQDGRLVLLGFFSVEA